MEEDSSSTSAEVIEVIKKLSGGKAPGVNKIHLELTALDMVGLSWLICLFNLAWRWFPIFKKGDLRVCSNYILLGVVYSRVLESKLRLIVEPQIQDERCGFRPGRGTVDHIFTLRVTEGIMGV